MSSLKNLNEVQEALSKIAQRNSIEHDNGTFGIKVKCSLWHVEEQMDKEHQRLMGIIVQKKFASMDYSQEKAALEALPAPKAMMVFKLVEPISVKGTKVINFEGKQLSPEIKVCSEIYIPQDIVNAELVSHEKTGDTTTNINGMDVSIIELDLMKCLIDVKEGKRDVNNPSKWKKMPRAYVTDIPFRSLQVVGNMMRFNDFGKYKAWNMMSDEDIQKFEGEQTII
jgi:hypothetical protein